MEDLRWIEGMICREEVEVVLKISFGILKFGVFLFWFVSLRIWFYFDVGVFVVSYVGMDLRLNYKLLLFDESFG